MTSDRRLRRLEIDGSEWHLDREILRLRDEHRWLATLRVGQAKHFYRQVHVDEPLGHTGHAGALQLRRDVAHQAMVRVSCSTIGTPRHHDFGTQALDLLRDAIRESREQRTIAEIVAKL